MLCTIVRDVYHNTERREVWQAMRELLPEHSPDWSRKGVYAYWDPDTHELLYIGLASNLPERFAQHNRLVPHAGGNKADQIDEWLLGHRRLGTTLLLQAAAVELLNDLYMINELLGVESSQISGIAEGQLIELHKQAHGRRPRWNKTGGSALGAIWARPTARSVVRLLSATEDNLFVARRSLRQLSRDKVALRREAFVNAARMRALLEVHEVDDAVEKTTEQQVNEIVRFLMLRSGKLVDDLTGVDDVVRAWVRRLARPEVMLQQHTAAVADLRQMIAGSDDPRDQMSALFIERLLRDRGEDEAARDAVDVLEAGYLDEAVSLPH